MFRACQPAALGLALVLVGMSPKADAAPQTITAEQLVQSMDGNRDGMISKDEAPAELKANFAHVDANRDGMIDVREARVLTAFINERHALEQGQNPVDQGPGHWDGVFTEGATRMAVETLVHTFDANTNNSIEEDELQNGFVDMLARFDACRGKLLNLFDDDRDGTLNEAECQAARDFAFGLAGMLQYDANRDWQVDDKEADQGWVQLAAKAIGRNEKGPEGRAAAPIDTALFGAAVEGQLDVVREKIAAGADLNAKDDSGSTPLIVAATFGRSEVAKALIEAGADLNRQNNEGSTALITAAFLCRTEIVQALLDKGADRNMRNKAGATALDSVAGPFEDVRFVYDLLGGALGPMGLQLDYEQIKATRPNIAAMLR